jgi:hypothetical protein
VTGREAEREAAAALERSPVGTVAHVLSKLSGTHVADWSQDQTKLALLLDRIVDAAEAIVGCKHSPPVWRVNMHAARMWCAACGTIIDTNADPFIVRDLRRYLEALRIVLGAQEEGSSTLRQLPERR